MLICPNTGRAMCDQLYILYIKVHTPKHLYVQTVVSKDERPEEHGFQRAFNHQRKYRQTWASGD